MQLSRFILNQFDYNDREKVEEVVYNNISRISNTFKVNDTIVYQELDSIDNPELYQEDDVVEVFIRANAGGTVLGKSDLLFSLLGVSWEEADVRLDDLLEELNKDGFNFTRDFVLKTSLTLLKLGARYEVQKFRNPINRQEIIDNWEHICNSIKDVKDFLVGKTYIRSDKALISYLTLIPLVYFRYHYPNEWSKTGGMDDYILRTLLAGTFSGTPDQLIDACTNKIDELDGWNTRDIFGVIRRYNRSLEITKEELFEIGYESKLIHLLFNLWYKDFNYHPSFENNKPQIDHIFPQCMLRTIKEKNPETGHFDIMKYKKPQRDQLANCMLLTAEENATGGKGDSSPEKWFEDKNNEYLERHLVPNNPELWKIDNYEQFIEARKQLIKEKFDYLLLSEKDI